MGRERAIPYLSLHVPHGECLMIGREWTIPHLPCEPKGGESAMAAFSIPRSGGERFIPREQ